MDPENELFDAACDVLDAARRLREATRAHGCEPAVAATLGCLSSALGSLADASTDLRTHARSGDEASLRDLARTLEFAVRLADEARSSSRLPP